LVELVGLFTLVKFVELVGFKINIDIFTSMEYIPISDTKMEINPDEDS